MRKRSILYSLSIFIFLFLCPQLSKAEKTEVIYFFGTGLVKYQDCYKNKDETEKSSGLPTAEMFLPRGTVPWPEKIKRLPAKVIQPTINSNQKYVFAYPTANTFKSDTKIIPQDKWEIGTKYHYTDSDIRDSKERLSKVFQLKRDVHYIVIVSSQGWVPFFQNYKDLSKEGLWPTNFDLILNQPAGKGALLSQLPVDFPTDVVLFDQFTIPPRICILLSGYSEDVRKGFNEPIIGGYRVPVAKIAYGPIVDLATYKPVKDLLKIHSDAVGGGFQDAIPPILGILSKNNGNNQSTLLSIKKSINNVLNEGQSTRNQFKDNERDMEAYGRILPYVHYSKEDIKLFGKILTRQYQPQDYFNNVEISNVGGGGGAPFSDEPIKGGVSMNSKISSKNLVPNQQSKIKNLIEQTTKTRPSQKALSWPANDH